MKTPREILLARHRSAEPKLDAVRENVLASIARKRSADLQVRANESDSRKWPSALQILRELFALRPQAWAGLVAAWILIFALKLSTHDTSHAVLSRSSVTPEVFAAARQQKLFFFELAGALESQKGTLPKSLGPRPRSERRLSLFSV